MFLQTFSHSLLTFVYAKMITKKTLAMQRTWNQRQEFREAKTANQNFQKKLFYQTSIQ